MEFPLKSPWEGFKRVGSGGGGPQVLEEDFWDPAKAAAAALLIAANEDAFVLETAREFYSFFNLTRLKVKGDGSCWVYAILAPHFN